MPDLLAMGSILPFRVIERAELNAVTCILAANNNLDMHLFAGLDIALNCFTFSYLQVFISIVTVLLQLTVINQVFIAFDTITLKVSSISP